MDSTKNTYLVSVVIPAYNAEEYIWRTIESVLKQSRGADEIIVVDDGSTDCTGAAVKRFGEKIRYIRQENAGASVARNTGIEAAEHEWIAFLDADDEWLENKLQVQMSLLERDSDLMWCGGNYYNYLASSGRKAVRVPVEKARQTMGGKDYWDDYFNAFSRGIWGCTDTLVIKRDALKKAGMFTAGQQRANDLDMWFRVANFYPKFGYVCQPLAVYHLEVAESISQKQGFVKWQEEFLSRHLEIAKEHGRLEAFEPCVAKMLRLWMRGMLFNGRKKEIRNLLSRFGYVLPGYYRLSIRALTTFPGVTRAGCRMISKVVRKFNLRRQVVRKPR